MFSSLKYSLPLSFLMLVFFSCTDNNPAPVQQVNVEPAAAKAQEKRRAANMDKSPVDIAYFPEDFPVLKMSGKESGDPVARVIYSRPSKDGREIFGNVVKYGTYWRLGANEGSEIEFFQGCNHQRRKSKKRQVYNI